MAGGSMADNMAASNVKIDSTFGSSLLHSCACALRLPLSLLSLRFNMAGRRTEMNLEGFFFLIALLTPVHCIGEDLHLPFLSQENLLPPLLTYAQLQVSSRNKGVSVEKYF
eukprot:XP_019920051.1 PREDICTED: uncharacterized protein LOC109617776 [Crassostrea gigas]